MTLPTDAFQAAKGYLVEVPEHVAVDVYRAERVVAQYNALVSAGSATSEASLATALNDVEGYVGTAYGALMRHLQVGSFAAAERR